MNILINASNLKAGGGLQVTESVCGRLDAFPQHRFTVVLSSSFGPYLGRIREWDHVRLVRHDVTNSPATLLLGRDRVLDRLAEEEGIDVVLTVFGPSRWEPRRPHLCGFARPHLVFPESPYFSRMNGWERLKAAAFNDLLMFFFWRGTRNLYSENALVSRRVENLFKGATCHTVTNYYHQVFDNPADWTPCPLPPFEGTTLLTIGADYAHKNVGIARDVARSLRENHPAFRFRFVLTLTEAQFPVPADLADCFVRLGRVDISQCPDLYRQADIMFQPRLLGCFSATYPEAMRMGVPIVTSDLPFAQGLCGSAALYFPALDAAAAAETIYGLAQDRPRAESMAAAGELRLKEYDSYTVRAQKLIALCEQVAKDGTK